MAKNKSKYEKEATDLVAPTATGDEPLDSRNNIDYWWKWLKAARENRYAVRHRADSLEAWKEYEKDYDFRQNVVNTMGADRYSVYPIYNASSQILESAFYSRTPEVITQREFEINDDIANTMALISERLGRYQVKVSNFDDVMNACVGDYMHSAKATNQLIYEAEIINQTKRNPLSMIGDNQFSNAQGEIHEGEVQQDSETGEYFHETQEQVADPKTQKIYLAPVPFDEILHSPNAKTFKDITEMAYYFTYTKDEAEKKFDKTVLDNYPWKSGTPKPDKKTGEIPGMEIESPDKYMDGWEVYCKLTKKVYWVSEDYRQDFLKAPMSDPYGLENMFPSPPFIIQNKPRKTLYPRPPYIYLRPTLDQLNIMYERTFGLIDSIRRRAIVDGDEDIVSLLNGGDQEFVSARSLKNIIEKGGLDKMIWFLPVQELVAAVSELAEIEDRFKANVETWYGTPAIAQGLSDPIEAYGTQQIKASAVSDRFRKSKKDVQRLARDSIEMMVDLALKVFSDEKIADICGYQYMDLEDQRRFMPALQTLRDDSERVVRVDIETDSMTFVDEDLRANRRNIAIQSALNGIKEITPLFQQDPIAGRVGLKAILLQLENNSEGKQFQDEIKALGKELMDNASQPKPPPPPDPMIAIRQQELQLKDQKQQSDAQAKSQELQLKGAIASDDMQIKAQGVQVLASKNETQAQQDATKTALDQSNAQFQQQVDAETIHMEKIKLLADQREKDQQQARLDKEQLLEAIKLVHDHVIAIKQIASGDRASTMQHVADIHATNSDTKTSMAQLAQQKQSAPNLPSIKTPSPKPSTNINSNVGAPPKKIR